MLIIWCSLLLYWCPYVSAAFFTNILTHNANIENKELNISKVHKLVFKQQGRGKISMELISGKQNLYLNLIQTTNAKVGIFTRDKTLQYPKVDRALRWIGPRLFGQAKVDMASRWHNKIPLSDISYTNVIIMVIPERGKTIDALDLDAFNRLLSSNFGATASSLGELMELVVLSMKSLDYASIVLCTLSSSLNDRYIPYLVTAGSRQMREAPLKALVVPINAKCPSCKASKLVKKLFRKLSIDSSGLLASTIVAMLAFLVGAVLNNIADSRRCIKVLRHDERAKIIQHLHPIRFMAVAFSIVMSALNCPSLGCVVIMTMATLLLANCIDILG